MNILLLSKTRWIFVLTLLNSNQSIFKMISKQILVNTETTPNILISNEQVNHKIYLFHRDISIVEFQFFVYLNFCVSESHFVFGVSQ